MFTSGVEARKHGCSERNPPLLCFRNQIMQCDYTHIVPPNNRVAAEEESRDSDPSIAVDEDVGHC
ncbi:MAG: hypothetical protein OXH86_05775 [Acidimicrobiaceae bacterium]|nr:hypothetical protein [Acidimicrobiaceae bacterium]